MIISVKGHTAVNVTEQVKLTPWRSTSLGLDPSLVIFCQVISDSDCCLLRWSIQLYERCHDVAPAVSSLQCRLQQRAAAARLRKYKKNVEKTATENTTWPSSCPSRRLEFQVSLDKTQATAIASSF